MSAFYIFHSSIQPLSTRLMKPNFCNTKSVWNQSCAFRQGAEISKTKLFLWLLILTYLVPVCLIIPSFQSGLQAWRQTVCHGWYSLCDTNCVAQCLHQWQDKIHHLLINNNDNCIKDDYDDDRVQNKIFISDSGIYQTFKLWLYDTRPVSIFQHTDCDICLNTTAFI